MGQPTSATVCAPGGAEEVPIGRECEDSGSCTAGTQQCLSEASEPAVPDGYCTTPCRTQAPVAACPSSSTCVPHGPEGDGLCFASCTADADCAGLREDTASTPLGCSVRLTSGQRVPEGGRVCVPHNPDAAIGDPCVNGSDCGSGLGRCIFDGARSAPRYVGGYCTVDCAPGAAENTCGDDAVCQDISRGSTLGGSCVKRCQADSDCRVDEGYRCLPSTAGPAACLPPA